MIKKLSVGPLLISAPPALVFFGGHDAAVEPSFFGRWRHAVLAMMVQFDLGGRVGRDSEKTINQSMSLFPSYSDSLAATLPLLISVFVVNGAPRL